MEADAYSSINTEMLGKGYGMPSSHAQFLSFFSVYLTLWLLLRHRPRSQHSHPSSAAPGVVIPTSLPLATLALHVLTSLSVLSVAAAVAASRVYLSYHTPKQVLVGCGAGVFAAVIWFGFTSWLRAKGWVDWALDLRVARMLRARDLCVEEDIVVAGWREWDKRREERWRSGGKGKMS